MSNSISSASDRPANRADSTAGERSCIYLDWLIADLRKYPMLSTPQYAADRLDLIEHAWRDLQMALAHGGCQISDKSVDAIAAIRVALARTPAEPSSAQGPLSNADEIKDKPWT